MVATSKMKRAQDRVAAARPYARALGEVISDLYSPELAERFPLLRQPAQVKRVAVLLLTANRGLAGAFNANLIKEARTLVRQLEDDGITVDLHIVGRKGIGFFRYLGRELLTARTDISDRPTAEDARSLADGLIAQYIDGTLDGVYLVYAKFNSALSIPPTVERVLPIQPPERTGAARDYILAPDADSILRNLLPSYMRNAVYRALVEMMAGYYSAQRTAMKNATDNATDTINVLRRTFNRARQAQITQEIAEIVGGAAALE
jgi:F-type H+-transporting ATPase subunit gamma